MQSFPRTFSVQRSETKGEGVCLLSIRRNVPLFVHSRSFRPKEDIRQKRVRKRVWYLILCFTMLFGSWGTSRKMREGRTRVQGLIVNQNRVRRTYYIQDKGTRA